MDSRRLTHILSHGTSELSLGKKTEITCVAALYSLIQWYCVSIRVCVVSLHFESDLIKSPKSLSNAPRVRLAFNESVLDQVGPNFEII